MMIKKLYIALVKDKNATGLYNSDYWVSPTCSDKEYLNRLCQNGKIIEIEIDEE